MKLPFPPPHPIYVSFWQHGTGNIVFPSCCQVVFYIFSYVIFCSSLVHFVVNVFNVFNGCVIYFIDKKKIIENNLFKNFSTNREKGYWPIIFN